MRYIDADNLIHLYCQNRCGEHFDRCENPCNVVRLVDGLALEEEIARHPTCARCGGKITIHEYSEKSPGLCRECVVTMGWDKEDNNA